MSDVKHGIENPWREFIENCISGSNYFRASEYWDLLADLDRGYAAEARLAELQQVIDDRDKALGFEEVPALSPTAQQAFRAAVQEIDGVNLRRVKELEARLADAVKALQAIADYPPGTFRPLADEIAIWRIATDAIDAARAADSAPLDMVPAPDGSRVLCVADSASAVTPFCGPFPEQSEDERTLRYMLALRCGEPGELYGDDGELQLGGFPYPIDFRRDSVAEIRRKLDARGMAKLAKQLKAADSEDASHE